MAQSWLDNFTRTSGERDNRVDGTQARRCIKTVGDKGSSNISECSVGYISLYTPRRESPNSVKFGIIIDYHATKDYYTC